MLSRLRTKAAGILAAAMLFATAIPAQAAEQNQSVKDGASHWAQADLEQWQEKGWLKGDGSGDLRPNDAVTRGELAGLINRSFGLTAEAEISFSDVTVSSWVYGDIRKAVAAGYLKGYADGTVKPGREVSRQEAAVMIAAAAKLELNPEAQLGFSDAGSVASWGKGAVQAAAAASLINGYPDGSFKPAKSLSRAEAVVILNKAVSGLSAATRYDQAGEYGPETGTQTLKGNVVIGASGVTLRNTEIEGDLTIAESVGEGDVYLKNVTVKGTTTVKGGGQNSIHFENSVMVTVIVDKQSGSVRIVANGATLIDQVQVQSPVKLEEDGVTGGGIGAVTLASELPKDSKVDLVGSFETVNVLAQNIVVAIPKGSVNNLNIDKSAGSTEINVSAEAQIISLVLNAAANVVGKGQIKTATVNAEGVKMEQSPAKIETGKDLAIGAKIVIGNAEKAVEKAAEEAAQQQTPPAATGPSAPGPSAPSTPSTPTPDVQAPTLSFFERARAVSGEILVEGGYLSFSEELTSVQQKNGEWELTFGNRSYNIGVWKEDGTPVALTRVTAGQHDKQSAELSFNYRFTNRTSLTVKLFAGSTSNPVMTSSVTANLPANPHILSAADQDRTPGLDGRDITVTWLPAVWNLAVKTELYILPIGVQFDRSTAVPAASFTDLTVNAWTGNEATKDSQGNPLRANAYYQVYVVMSAQNPLEYRLTQNLLQPTVDLVQETGAGPDPLVMPGPNDPIPQVKVSEGTSYSQPGQTIRGVTVGDAVYGVSDRTGYLFLIPNHISRSVIMMNLAVTEGKGIRKAVTAGEGVVFDTSYMANGEYRLVGVSEKNAVSVPDGYSDIMLYAPAAEPLEIAGLGHSTGSSTFYVEFNRKIAPAQDIAALKNAITVQEDGAGEYALSAGDTVEIDGYRPHVLEIRFVDRVPAGEFSIKIAAGAIMDNAGQVLTDDVEAGAVEFGAKVTMISQATVYKIGESITFKTNKAATVFLIRSMSGTLADFEAEVVALRAKKVEAPADMEITISTEGLTPGNYSVLAWGGDSKGVQLIAP